jgi:hypothetical protein
MIIKKYITGCTREGQKNGLSMFNFIPSFALIASRRYMGSP